MATRAPAEVKTKGKKKTAAAAAAAATPDIEALVTRLHAASDAYYNTGEPLMSDAEFDRLRDELAAAAPDHPFLKEVGAAPSGAKRKVALPLWMGSMDKIKGAGTGGGLARWSTQWSGPYWISDKLDGMSGLLIGGQLLQRGSGTEGQDATHMLKYIRGVPRDWMTATKAPRGVAVRGEIILSRLAWDELVAQGVVEEGGEGIRRSRVAGVLNAKKPDLTIARLLDFVAYEWIDMEAAGAGKEQPPLAEQRQRLAAAGFFVVPAETRAALATDDLTALLEKRKREGPYILDGLIVHTGGPYVRAAGANPKYAFAFKTDAAAVTVTVTGVEWNESKDGLLKPRVLFEPVAIEGAMIAAATGFHARYIVDNGIGPGAVIGVIRSGDVIPYITRIERPAPGGPALPPEGDYEWTGDPAQALDIRARVPSALTGLVHFFNTLDVPGMGEGLVVKLHAAGFTRIQDFVRASPADFMRAEGIKERIAARLHEGIAARWAAADAVTLIVASNTMGRGFAAKRLAAIAAAIPDAWVRRPSEAELVAVPGVEAKTATAFLARWDAMTAFMREHGLEDRLRPAAAAPVATAQAQAQGTLTGRSYVFTGFRDAALEAAVVAAGGAVASSVSKKTTAVIVKEAGATSTKVTRAQELGVPVLTVAAFQAQLPTA